MFTLQDRSAGGRGVLASYGTVTPARDDVARHKLTLRDALFLMVGCAGMWGVQVATQMGMRSDIRNLNTSFDSYVKQQDETNVSLQRQITDGDLTLQREIDDARKQAALAIVNDALTAKELSELKGYMEGAGIKKLTK